MNKRYADLSTDQIRHSLSYMNKNYNLAVDQTAYGLADAIKDKIDGLWYELVNRIQSEDPCTTEADIRYFEGVNHV